MLAPLAADSFLASVVEEVHGVGGVRRAITGAYRDRLWWANVGMGNMGEGVSARVRQLARIAFELVGAMGAAGLPTDFQATGTSWIDTRNAEQFEGLQALKLAGLAEAFSTDTGRACRLTDLGRSGRERYHGAIDMLERAANAPVSGPAPKPGLAHRLAR